MEGTEPLETSLSDELDNRLSEHVDAAMPARLDTRGMGMLSRIATLIAADKKPTGYEATVHTPLQAWLEVIRFEYHAATDDAFDPLPDDAIGLNCDPLAIVVRTEDGTVHVTDHPNAEDCPALSGPHVAEAHRGDRDWDDVPFADDRVTHNR